MKRILIPTNFSELADYAFGIARKIAEATGARLHVLYIVPAPVNAEFTKEGKLKEIPGYDYDALYTERDKAMGKLLQWATDKADYVERVWSTIDHVEHGILDYIKNQDIDLVVMGTEGATGSKELISGSHAQHIVRESPVPVLTLKCDRSGMELDKMVFVSDFLDTSQPVDLSLIKELRQAFNAEMHLLKINTPASFDTTREAMRRMRACAEANALEKVHYHVYCDTDVERGIAHFSADTGMDFVVMGTHQRKGLSRLFQKSISESVVNHLWQPVLTFPIRVLEKSAAS